MFSPSGETGLCSIFSVAIRCSAQVVAPAASVSFHTSGATETAARSRLWMSKIALTKSAVLLLSWVAFPVIVTLSKPTT